MNGNRRISVIVNGNKYLVEAGDLSQFPFTVRVNGQDYEVRIDQEGIPAVTEATSSAERSNGQGENLTGRTVNAPMPGKIGRIEVEAGSPVRKDQVLCCLEAMKMQNAIRSPWDGMIARVLVSAGQDVGFGEALFELE